MSRWARCLFRRGLDRAGEIVADRRLDGDLARWLRRGALLRLRSLQPKTRADVSPVTCEPGFSLVGTDPGGMRGGRADQKL